MSHAGDSARGGNSSNRDVLGHEGELENDRQSLLHNEEAEEDDIMDEPTTGGDEDDDLYGFQSAGLGQGRRAVRTSRSNPNRAAHTYGDLTMSLLIPVSMTMLIVIFAVTTFQQVTGDGQALTGSYLVYHEQTADSTSKKLGGSLLNALVIVGVILGVTFLLLLLYKLRCMKIIFGWLAFSSLSILSVMGFMWVDLFCTAYQIPYDYVTAMFLLWNFGVVGVITVYWHGAKIMIQGYLIAISCIGGWLLTRFPEWTTWTILAAVAIYDIVAVLTPKGPLRLLVEQAQRNNEPLPGLVYESKAWKLGLGDFVFYSVLVGRAAMYFYITWAVCFLAIIMGLCCTLLAVGMFNKAMPALPISIALGILFYVLGRFLLTPYQIDLTLMGVWV